MSKKLQPTIEVKLGFLLLITGLILFGIANYFRQNSGQVIAEGMVQGNVARITFSYDDTKEPYRFRASINQPKSNVYKSARFPYYGSLYIELNGNNVPAIGDSIQLTSSTSSTGLIDFGTLNNLEGSEYTMVFAVSPKYQDQEIEYLSYELKSNAADTDTLTLVGLAFFILGFIVVLRQYLKLSGKKL
jgi:hypothetical protein